MSICEVLLLRSTGTFETQNIIEIAETFWEQ